MSKSSGIALKLVLTSSFVCGATFAGDLSRYRNVEFGANLSAVTRQIGPNVSVAKVIHSRPALIQELEWRPQSLGASIQTESANEVVLSFYNSELYRVAIKYDRYLTEGLTTQDIIEAVSTIYGPEAEFRGPAKVPEDRYGDQEEVVARWQDSQYRFDLIRSSYGPSYSLVGVMKRLDSPAQAAALEAKRLDNEEAPQRDAARRASEQDAARAQLEKARLVNKPRFRP